VTTCDRVPRSLYPFKGHRIDIGGHAYHYLDEGLGEPVVMLHGNPTWSFYYRDLVLALREQHRTLVPDHIGCGFSDKPPDAEYRYTLSQRVDDVEAFLEKVDSGDALTLVLHDWGGMIGMAWATQNPDRIARLVVMNTAAFPLPTGKNFPASLALARAPGIGALLVRGANAFSRGAVRLCVTRQPMSKAVGAGYLEPYDSWAHRIAVHRFVQDIPLKKNDRAYPIMKETGDALVHLLDKPMLICWGLKDFVFGRQFLDEWVRRFPEADVHRFEDCGHYVLEDAGEEIIPLIRTFVDRGPRSHPDSHPETQPMDNSA